MFSKIAIFTDLDGTLFNSKRVVSPENRDAICYFIQNGGTFGVSTARALNNTKPLLKGIPVNGWYLLLNGALAYDSSSDACLVNGTLDKDDAASLIRWMQQACPMVNTRLYSQTKMYYFTDPKYADQRVSYQYPELRQNSLEDARNDSWMRILLTAPRDLLEQVEHYALSQNLTRNMDIVYTEYECLEFIPKGVNKGNCLAKIAHTPSLAGKKIFAVGDYYNDRQLLENADVGVAVENAVPELKKIADCIACSNDHHALAYIIREILPSYIRNGYRIQ